MNGRVAKQIRKMCKDKLYDENGKYIRDCKVVVIKEAEKVVYKLVNGQLVPRKTKRLTLANANKYRYRKMKKEYNKR